MPTYKYPRPAVTVDSVIFAHDAKKRRLEVLLIRRKGAPFRGSWALPGGFVQMGESLDEAARRELAEETSLVRIPYLEQLYTFGDPGRDPRGRVISVAYFCLVASGLRPKANSDAAEAEWFPLDGIPPLAFDHDQIVTTAVDRLRAKVRYAPVGFRLLPDEFSMPELQGLYEAILASGLDKRNFRRRILASGLLKETGRRAKTVPPARLYRFDHEAYTRLTDDGFNFSL